MLKKLQILRKVVILIFGLYLWFAIIPWLLNSNNDLFVISGFVSIVFTFSYLVVYRHSHKRWFKDLIKK